MASITTRSGKGSALTHVELDNNFTNLNTDKLEVSTASSTYLAKAGGTMTGTLTFAAGQPTATISAPNIVQLTDATNSTSTTTAATPNSVKLAYDLADAALPKSGGSLTGNVDLTVNNSTTGFRIIQSGAGAPLIVTEGAVDRFAVKTSGIIELKPASTGTRLFKSDGTFYTAINTEAVTANRTITLPNGDVTLAAGTMAITGGNLGQFAATTSAQLAGVVSDETGSGSLVFATSPTLVTPALGAATATSITATGAVTAESLIPTGSTVPANGVYLPAADTVAISSSGQPRFIVSGNKCTIGAADAVNVGVEIGANPSGNRNSFIDLIGDQTYADYGARLIRGDTGANTNTSLIHRGTGELRLVATDPGTVAFHTANVERVRIDSAGRVGIGTTSPSSICHVREASDSGFVGYRAQNNNGLSGIAGIEFSSDSTYAKAAIGLVRTTLNGAGALVFYNDSNNDAAGWATTDEKMRIDSSGRVGIGTPSPGSTLDVKGTVRLSGSTSGYVGLAPAAAAGSTTYTLPTADGSSGQVLSTNGSGILSWATRTEIPSGTVMLFAQTNAPTGWTKSTTHDNKALRVVSGTAGSGGSAAFTTAFASRTPSGSVSGTNFNGFVQSHTLTLSQIPSHTHTYVESYIDNDSEDGNGTVTNTGGFINNTGAAGGGLSHSHSFVNPTWSGTFTGSAMDFAVAYVDVIIAAKD